MSKAKNYLVIEIIISNLDNTKKQNQTWFINLKEQKQLFLDITSLNEHISYETMKGNFVTIKKTYFSDEQLTNW